MLPKGLWASYEPRAVVPVFADARTFLDFSVQPTLAPRARSYAEPLYWALKKKKKPLAAAIDYWNLALRRPLAFRAILVSRHGHYLAQWPLAKGLRVGDFFSTDVSALAESSGIAAQDALLIVVANRGRTDLWSSSPGSLNVRYVGERTLCGFRTGLFARTLNPVQGAAHFGFTGLNPQVRIDGSMVPSVLLMNHSSEPEYDRTVSPTIRLHRSHDEFLEAPFGTIAPHGALERAVADLFPDAQSFLGAEGRGYTIAHNKGASLASLHVIRARDGSSMALDHSRPAHTNVVAYI
jgi:hypothetical protein